jgi:tRNA(Ile)-lysidine synthetase-like protein
MTRKFDPNHIATFFQEQSIKLAGNHFLVALSGGLDSTVLAKSLSLLAAKHEYHVTLGHVNHNLRSDSAVDSGFCRELAVQLGLPLRVVNLEPDYEPGDSIEAWARDARYAALSAMCNELGANWILTGHHLDDQAETIFMRLKQGAPLITLAGIRERRDNILRPLLSFRRSDLAVWAKEQDLSWIEDPSNSDTTFLRNDLRLGILKDMQQQNPGLIYQLAELAELGRQYESWLTAGAEKFIGIAEPGSIEGTITLPRAAFLALDDDVSKIGLIHVINTHLGESLSIGAKQWHSFRHFVRVGKTGKIFDLTKDVKVLLDREQLFLYSIEVARIPEQQSMAEGKINWWGHRLFVKQLKSEGLEALNIRSWQAQDRVALGGSGQHKLVSDIFIDAKLNHIEKLHWPIITNDQSVPVWVPGLTSPKKQVRILGWEVSWQR